MARSKQQAKAARPASQVRLFPEDRLLDMPLAKKRSAECSAWVGGGSAFITMHNLEAPLSWELDIVRPVAATSAPELLAKALTPYGGRALRPLAEPHAAAAKLAAVPSSAIKLGDGVAEFGLQSADDHEYFFSKFGDLVGIVRIKRREGGAWSASMAKSCLPRVIGKEAVSAGLMPPPGKSALPASLEAVVPAEFRYWTATDGEQAVQMRDALVESGFFSDDCVKAVDGELRKVEVRYFVYEPQTDVSPKQAARPTTFGDKVAGLIPAQLADGVFSPFEAKDGDWLEELDSKDATDTTAILSAPSSATSPRELVRAAATLKGDWLIDCDDTEQARQAMDMAAQHGLVFKLAGSPERLLATSFVPASLDGVEFIVAAATHEPSEQVFSQDFSISKALQAGTGGDERYVLGIVLEPDIVDAQKDTYSSDEIRQAEHKFMEEFRTMGLMHKEVVNEGVKILESYLAPVDFELGGITVKKGTWLMAVRVVDDGLWAQVKGGGLTGFSIGGSAIRKPVSESSAAAEV